MSRRRQLRRPAVQAGRARRAGPGPCAHLARGRRFRRQHGDGQDDAVVSDPRGRVRGPAVPPGRGQPEAPARANGARVALQAVDAAVHPPRGVGAAQKPRCAALPRSSYNVCGARGGGAARGHGQSGDRDGGRLGLPRAGAQLGGARAAAPPPQRARARHGPRAGPLLLLLLPPPPPPPPPPPLPPPPPPPPASISGRPTS